MARPHFGWRIAAHLSRRQDAIGLKAGCCAHGKPSEVPLKHKLMTTQENPRQPIRRIAIAPMAKPSVRFA